MPTLHCPICHQVFDIEASLSMPFCSPRCKQIDLGRWLGEEYGLPYESEDQPLREHVADEE